MRLVSVATCNRMHGLTPGPLFVVLFVFTQTISSHLRKPHFAMTSRPRSRPSPDPLPTQSRTKDGSAESAGIGRFCRSSQVNDDENGGSIRMTSNLEPCSDDSSE